MTAKAMEQGLADGVYIDYWPHDNHFLCIPVSAIKDTCEQVDKPCDFYHFDILKIELETCHTQLFWLPNKIFFHKAV